MGRSACDRGPMASCHPRCPAPGHQGAAGPCLSRLAPHCRPLRLVVNFGSGWPGQAYRTGETARRFWAIGVRSQTAATAWRETTRIQEAVREEFGWLDGTTCDRCGGPATIHYTVWSDALARRRCGAEIGLRDV